MRTINLSPSEETIFRDYKDGNSVQVRVSVPSGESNEYEKGAKVRVVYGEYESTGRIVSDPLVVKPAAENEEETISLIVEKEG